MLIPETDPNDTTSAAEEAGVSADENNEGDSSIQFIRDHVLDDREYDEYADREANGDL